MVAKLTVLALAAFRFGAGLGVRSGGVGVGAVKSSPLDSFPDWESLEPASGGANPSSDVAFSCFGCFFGVFLGGMVGE